MNATIYQGWSDAYQELADITWPNKVAYAERHGYRPVSAKHPPTGIMWDRPRQWANLMDSMPDGDFALCCGCDTLVTRPDRPLSEFVDDDHDLFVCVDGALVFGDAFIARASPLTRRFFRTVADPSHGAGNEQLAMTFLLSGKPWQPHRGQSDERGTDEWFRAVEASLNSTDVRVRVVNQLKLASDDAAQWNGAIPGYNNGPLAANQVWTRDHLILHMGGHSYEHRLREMPKYLPAP